MELTEEIRIAATLTRRTAFWGAAYLGSAALFCRYVIGHPASRFTAMVVLSVWAEAFLIRGCVSLATLAPSRPRRLLWFAAAGLAVLSTFYLVWRAWPEGGA